MGFDRVQGIGTGCQGGMKRLAAYLFDRFQVPRNLGCFNRASVAGGGPSLHAEGRAQDFGVNAFDDAERAIGDALFVWAVQHADEIGLQEMLWRGAIWYYPRKNTEHGWGDFQMAGVYGPAQKADHMSHVHLGVDADAGANWTTDWLTEGDDMPLSDDDVERVTNSVARYMTGQNQALNDAGISNLGTLFNHISATCGGGSGSDGGLSEAEVRTIVREELDRTRLSQ